MAIIAQNTFKEIIRDRVLYGIMLFALMLFGFSVSLGELSFAEQARIAASFGFAAIQLAAVVLSIFVGSTLVSRELDKKTILTLLTRPVSRTEFLIGKTIGLLLVIFMSMAVLAFALMLILLLIGYAPNVQFFVGLHGIVLEAAVLLGFTIFFGSFTTPMLAVSFVVGVFLIVHWVESLKFLTEDSAELHVKLMAGALKGLMPNLEVFNWKGLYINADLTPWRPFWWANLYTLAWVVFLGSISAAILNRRNLG